MRCFKLQDLTDESENVWRVTTGILAQRGQLNKIASETKVWLSQLPLKLLHRKKSDNINKSQSRFLVFTTTSQTRTLRHQWTQENKQLWHHTVISHCDISAKGLLQNNLTNRTQTESCLRESDATKQRLPQQYAMAMELLQKISDRTQRHLNISLKENRCIHLRNTHLTMTNLSNLPITICKHRKAQATAPHQFWYKEETLWRKNLQTRKV